MSKLKPKIDNFVGFMSTISPREVRPFEQFAEIKDKEAFAKQLERLLSSRFRHLDEREESTLKERAQRLEMNASWVADATAIQRGRAVLNKDFNAASNLPVARFAQLAEKSRQQIYDDIDNRRLLALDVNRRGKRLPDWQLERNALALTQRVLALTEGVDNWSIFRELSDPAGRFAGNSPVEAVQGGADVEEVAAVVLRALGVDLASKRSPAHQTRQAAK